VLDLGKVAAIAGPAIAVLGILTRVMYGRFRHAGGREIESFTSYLSLGLKYYLGRPLRRRLAAELTLRQYARAALRTTARVMPVPAVAPVRLDIDRIFVPLLLRGSNQVSVGHQTLLSRPSERLLILGDPGSGKSSLLKRTFRDACRKAATAPGKAQMPLLFELKNLIQAANGAEPITGTALLAQVQEQLTTSAAYLSKTPVKDLSAGAGLLVLLDGLDEIPGAMLPAVMDAILEVSRQLSSSAPRATVIVSSRLQLFQAPEFREFLDSFDVLSIRPFALEDIYRFLSRWPFGADAAAQITRIFTRLRRQSSLAEMCTNPLALAMYVARDQQTGGSELFETRTSFYRSLLDELLVNRRIRRQDSRGGRQQLREKRLAVLGETCLEHLLALDEPANSISQSRLKDVLVAHTMASAADSEEEMNDLSIDTGLFSAERERETFRFLHLTLCEFLAARELVERGESAWQQVVAAMEGPQGSVTRSRLAEVVAFAGGLAPRSLRQQIFQDLVAAGRYRLLVRAGMEAQAYEDPVIVEGLAQEMARLAAVPEQDWQAPWFADLRVVISALRESAAAPAAGGPDRESAIAGYVTGLMRTPEREALLLGTLAQFDGEAAIGVAEAREGRAGIRLVVAAATDLSVLVAILGHRRPGSADAWSQELVNRALVDSRLAHLLASIGQQDSAPDGTWSSYLTRGTVYGELLAAHRDSEVARPDEPDPPRLGDLRPPRSGAPAFWRPLLINLTAVLVVTSVIVVGVVVMIRVIPSWPHSFGQWSAVIAVFVYLGRLLFRLRDGKVLAVLRTWWREWNAGRAVTVRIEFGGNSLELSNVDDEMWASALAQLGKQANENLPSIEAPSTASARRDRVWREIFNLSAYTFGQDLSRWTRFATGVRQPELDLLADLRRRRTPVGDPSRDHIAPAATPASSR
jgi:hypothetical protein